MEPTSLIPRKRSFGRGPRVLGLGIREWLVLIIYCGMVCFAVLYYRQSEDEARAWVLSRSFPLGTLIFHMIRYEGHPGLYYFLLWTLSHAGVSFVCINWLSAVSASGAIYLLLRFSPFPFYLKALIPFGFYLGYQYAVDARSYALFALFGFTAVNLYRRAPDIPVAMAVVLALFANISLHATMVAIGLAVAYAAQFRAEGFSVACEPRRAWHTWLSLGIFGASILFVLFCVWPVKYMHSPAVVSRRIVRRLFGPTSERPSHDSVTSSAYFPHTSVESRTQVASPTAIVNPPPQGMGDRVRKALIYPIATLPALAALFEVLVALYLLRRRRAVLLLPFALLSYFFIVVYVQVWHSGLIWVTLILLLWAAWDEEANPLSWTLQNAVAVLLASLCALQLPWTIEAIRYERSHDTFPAKSAALFLSNLPPSNRIDGNQIAFTVMPYFSHYIFLDHGEARFVAHTGYPADISIADFVSEHADEILLQTSSVTAMDRNELYDAGYTEKHVFCGAPFFPNRPIKLVCISIFEKN